MGFKTVLYGLLRVIFSSIYKLLIKMLIYGQKSRHDFSISVEFAFSVNQILKNT